MLAFQYIEGFPLVGASQGGGRERDVMASEDEDDEGAEES